VHPRNTIIAMALALTAPWCAAQTVYRCGSSYGTQPCAGGTAVDTAHNGPTASEAARAARVTDADAKRADAMEKARLAQEKRGPTAVIIGPAEPPKAAASEKKTKPVKPEQFTATVPGTGKPKKKN
jgi:hypothetical protein